MLELLTLPALTVEVTLEETGSAGPLYRVFAGAGAVAATATTTGLSIRSSATARA